MIGLVVGLGLAISYLGAAWTPNTFEGSLFNLGFFGALAVLTFFTLIGIFLFPRTVGMALTPMSFVTPVAFLIAFFRYGFTYAIFILGIGVSAWLVTLVIGKLRPDAT